MMQSLELYSSFVATVLHPVFITNNAARKVEIDFDPETGEARIVRSKVIKEYLSVPVFKGWAMPGQPKMQVSFPLRLLADHN